MCVFKSENSVNRAALDAGKKQQPKKECADKMPRLLKGVCFRFTLR